MDHNLEKRIIELATKKRVILATAESCTGGFLAHRLTNVPGASAVFWGGWVIYSNEAKMVELDVSPNTIEKKGAVSQEVAEEMARAALLKSGASMTVSLTGIAGPGGGSTEKPVGLVYIGLAWRMDNGSASNKIEISSQKHLLCSTDRLLFKEEATDTALQWMRDKLMRC